MPDIVAEVIGRTDDGQLVEIYVEAEPFNRHIRWLVLFFLGLVVVGIATFYLTIAVLSS